MANFHARIADTARQYGPRPAVEMFGAAGTRTTTYSELLTLADRFACWLSATGVSHGDRVALLAPNDARWVAAYLGILRIGAVAVPLDTAYSPAQLETIVRDCDSRLVLVGAKQTAAATTGLSATPARVVPLDEEPAAPNLVPPSVAVQTSDAAVILYTSGTTADPKGVVLTHANLEAERRSALAVIDVTPADAVLGVLPLYHALAQMANLLLPLSAGARVVFLETIDSASLLAALAARPITIFACVPQFFYLIHQRVLGEVARRGAVARVAFRALVVLNGRLRDGPGINLGPRLFARVHRTLGPHMRLLITGGSRFDPAIARDLYGLGLTLLNGYGLTETSGAATVQRPGDRFTTSVGPPLPGVEVRIVAEPGTPEADSPERPAADAMRDGEIQIRGDIVMRGYHGRTDATADALHDGWLHTGDLGYLDDQGRLFITGRKKDVIVLASGKNLYPEELEAHYRQSAFIKELCVLGVARPGEPSAERLHAVVVPDEDALRARGTVNIRELIRFDLEGLSVALPPHKRILSYDIAREPLPRTTTGKVRRGEVERHVLDRARAASSLGTTAAMAAGDDRPLSDAESTWLAEADHRRAVAHIARALGRNSVAPDANLELDLGLDSMERVELLTAVEAAWNRSVAPDVRATIFTVRQLVDAIAASPSGHIGRDDAPPDEAGWTTLLAQADPTIARDLTRPTLVRGLVIAAGLRLAGWLSRLAIDWRVDGLEHVPRSGACLLCPNHQSYLDGFFLAAALPFGVFRRLFVVGAAEYFGTPWSAAVARWLSIVPVDADANLVSAMQAAASGLRLGKVLILFPEGERSIDGTIKPFRKGAVILARELAVPIVPIAVSGFFEIWPRGRGLAWRALRPWTRRPVRIRVGTPWHPEGGDDGASARALEAQVAALQRGG